MADAKDIEGYRNNLQDEIDVAAMHRALAGMEEFPEEEAEELALTYQA